MLGHHQRLVLVNGNYLASTEDRQIRGTRVNPNAPSRRRAPNLELISSVEQLALNRVVREHDVAPPVVRQRRTRIVSNTFQKLMKFELELTNAFTEAIGRAEVCSDPAIPLVVAKVRGH
jgi:L-fucose mutarotase/ribose pyranase (RbsD/FucU family)